MYSGAGSLAGSCVLFNRSSGLFKTDPSPGIDGIFLAPHSITADNMYNCGLEVGVS